MASPLSAAALAALPPSTLASLSADYLARLPIQTLQSLTIATIRCLSPSAIDKLPLFALESLPPGTLNVLPPSTVGLLSASTVDCLRRVHTRSMLRLSEVRLNNARRQLGRVELAEFFPEEVERLEQNVERLRRELRVADTDEEARLLKMAIVKAQGRLQGARDTLARFHSDPQRVTNERREALERERDQHRLDANKYRKALGLTPLSAPCSRK